MTALLVSESPPCTPEARLGLGAPLLLAPPFALGVIGPGPLPAFSASALLLTQTIDEPIARPRLKKMPALVPGGWALIARGALSVVVGSIAFGTKSLAPAALASLVAAYAIADGTCTLFGTLRTTRASERWWPLLLEGLVSIGLGAQLVLWPGIGTQALVYYVAFWSLVAGTLALGAASRVREEITGEWLLALRGLSALGLGAMLVFRRGEGTGGLLLWLGPSATLFGAFHVALGLRLRARSELPKYDARQLLRSF
jgi:uncharacterized membrane protein HdeD (DUF308 family)